MYHVYLSVVFHSVKIGGTYIYHKFLKGLNQIKLCHI
jgi:hypothetical protein